MKDRFDKLGRRIPHFDRSAAGRKASKTRKERHGPHFDKKTGSMGGRKRTRGYFGQLKDQGKTDELKKISTAGAAASNTAQGKNRNDGGRDDGARGGA